ncbi:hypothetical protein [Pseudolactococcus yaeyamensis]
MLNLVYQAGSKFWDKALGRIVLKVFLIQTVTVTFLFYLSYVVSYLNSGHFIFTDIVCVFLGKQTLTPFENVMIEFLCYTLVVYLPIFIKRHTIWVSRNDKDKIIEDLPDCLKFKDKDNLTLTLDKKMLTTSVVFSYLLTMLNLGLLFKFVAFKESYPSELDGVLMILFLLLIISWTFFIDSLTNTMKGLLIEKVARDDKKREIQEIFSYCKENGYYVAKTHELSPTLLKMIDMSIFQVLNKKKIRDLKFGEAFRIDISQADMTRYDKFMADNEKEVKR